MSNGQANEHIFIINSALQYLMYTVQCRMMKYTLSSRMIRITYTLLILRDGRKKKRMKSQLRAIFPNHFSQNMIYCGIKKRRKDANLKQEFPFFLRTHNKKKLKKSLDVSTL